MPAIDGVVVKCFPGHNIVKLIMKLDKTLKGHIELSPFDYIIVHVGTNNIDRRDSYDNIIADHGNLIPVIENNKSSIRIIMSAIQPRPVDHDETDEMINKVNGCLRSIMGPDLGFHFVETWKAVCKFGTFKRYLYAKNDKGLHLNTEGSRRLRHFFLRVISTID